MQQIAGTTKVLAVFGDPIAHSLSPLMQNLALTKAGLDAVYVPCHVPAGEIGEAVAGVRAMNFRGVNLTVPHKEAVCPFLDELDPDARLIGAVNTIVNRSGRLTGYNTDVYGFLNSLKLDLQFDPVGKRVLLLGAGGASRAVLVALCRAGARWVGVANRTFRRAQALVAEFSPLFAGTDFAAFHLESGELSGALDGIDLLVNVSAVGLKGETFDCLPWDDVPRAVPVFDLVYSRQETPLVVAARARGHRATDGLGMLAGQGEQAFELWTGMAPATGVMRDCLLARRTAAKAGADGLVSAVSLNDNRSA
jgi:shikimate dehydrogenase